MNLKYIPLKEDYQHYSKLKYLYEHAFPEAERPPFSILVSFKNNQIFAVEKDDEFVGLFTVVDKDDLLYLFFLAVKKKYRKEGIGSQIIKDIFTRYQGKRIFLLAEDVDVPCDNKQERLSRIKFYEKNGLFRSGEKVIEYEIAYEILDNRSGVGKNDFLKVMEYTVGDFYPIYVKNVK